MGSNIVTKPETEPTDLIKINEIFYSIEGEGNYSGNPAIFVRTAGCNLSLVCQSFCDTLFDEYALYHVDQLISHLNVFHQDEMKNRNVIIKITGGEALLQYATIELCYKLVTEYGRYVQIESNGTYWPINDKFKFLNTYVYDQFSIMCSPKTPKIDERFKAKYWKYLVNTTNGVDEQDGLPLNEKGIPIAKPNANHYNPKIYIQPMDEYNEEKNKANIKLATDICLKYGYNLSLQIHKIVGVS
jgi:7-carboxy-7-deazaguanine synthase